MKASQRLNKKDHHANSLWAIGLPLAVFLALGVFFAIERAGIIFKKKEQPALTALPADYIIPKASRKPELRSLVIYDSSEVYSNTITENIAFVLDQMSVGVTLYDIAYLPDFMPVLPPLRNYKTVVITLDRIVPIYAVLEQILGWVREGGGLLFAIPPGDRVLTTLFNRDMGVEYGVYNFVPQLEVLFETDLMIGSQHRKIAWSEGELETDYRFGVNFAVDESATVHLSSTGPQGSTPMLWETRAGRGRIVVNNNDGMAVRWSRGLVAAAYSLTEPAVAWPVINASMFFIDDFPSPIAAGHNEYIRRDYDLNNDYFYTSIWFPDMLRIADKYHIKYTGVFIETYTDNVDPPFRTVEDTERMKYFGSMFLTDGHEIGLHGYNHQSLVFEGFDYQDMLPYNKWKSEVDMALALSNTVQLQKELFPGNVMKTYVPPSNVLSREGRDVLKRYFPEITAISGLLNDGLFGLHDDFGIGNDGLVNIPRIMSGYFPLEEHLDEPVFWEILSELNFHFVNSHFIHPDDVMDPERGAERGWKSLIDSFEEYLSWLGQFPIRSTTAQEAVGAVQRYDNLNVRTRLSDSEITLDIGGLYDEAYLFVRINDGKPGETQGATLTQVSSTLYLLKAESPRVVIHLE